MARRLSPDEQARRDHPPIDPIFAEFIMRVLEPDDVITVSAIVVNLRAQMRRELGLDSSLEWLGGPELGKQS